MNEKLSKDELMIEFQRIFTRWGGLVGKEMQAYEQLKSLIEAQTEPNEEHVAVFPGIGAVKLSKGWLPTAENINALPESVRKYIYELETNCDPPSLVRDNIIIKENIRALEIRLKEAETKK